MHQEGRSWGGKRRLPGRQVPQRQFRPLGCCHLQARSPAARSATGTQQAHTTVARRHRAAAGQTAAARIIVRRRLPWFPIGPTSNASHSWHGPRTPGLPCSRYHALPALPGLRGPHGEELCTRNGLALAGFGRCAARAKAEARHSTRLATCSPLSIKIWPETSDCRCNRCGRSSCSRRSFAARGSCELHLRRSAALRSQGHQDRRGFGGGLEARNLFLALDRQAA